MAAKGTRLGGGRAGSPKRGTNPVKPPTMGSGPRMGMVKVPRGGLGPSRTKPMSRTTRASGARRRKGL